MKRTAYFNDTKPSQDQLNYTETSKTNAILERARSFSQFGVLTGFRVTVNGLNTTRIDIGVGEGYTGGYYLTSNLVGSGTGERIATNDGSYTATATSLALADYTNGAVNYVTLVFSETSSELLTERSYPFTSHATKYEETFSTSVLTAAGWAALTIPQKQNMILVAKVTARGIGAALSSTDIEQITQPKTHPIATQPSLVSGTTIQGVSETTPTGSAYLYFVAASKTMRFKAPTDTTGVSVPIIGSGEYTIYSSNTSYYIVVNVVYALLPVIDSTDTIDITSLYGRTLPLASAADSAHRDLTGSGLVTAKNAHGIALIDIQGGALSHAELFHLNGIAHEADATQLSGTILPATDSIEITNLGGTSNTFLIGGTEYETILGYTAGTSGQITLAGEVTSGDYLIYLDSAARLQRVLLADYAGGFDYVFWTDKIALYDMFNTSVGTGIISWNATTKVLKYQSPADNGGAGYGPDVYINARWGSVVSGYYTLFSGGLIDWVIVYVSDDLGVTASSSFTTGKTESAQPDDAILKLGVVTWRADTGNLVIGSYRDIRSFFTADNTMEFLSEHDENGLHTKELCNQLRIGVKNNAFQAIVETSSAGFFQARSGSVALSVSAPSSAMVIAASKNAAAYVYGAVVRATNNQNNAAAIPVGVYGLAGNTATELGIGVWGVGSGIGVVGQGSGIGVVGQGAAIGVSASGGTYGVVASCATAYLGVPIPGTFNNFYGVHISASTAAAIVKTMYAAVSANLNYAGAGASVKSAYGVVNVMDLSWATENVGFYNAVINSSNANIYYGFWNSQKASAVDHFMGGFKNLVDASSVVDHHYGISQYIMNSVTCPVVAGIDQTISAYDANVVYGIYNVGYGNVAAGKIVTAVAQYNSISVRNPDVIRGYFGNQSAVFCSVVAIGIENTMHYATVPIVYGAHIEADGASAATARGLDVSNAVTTSCGAGIYGIGNTLRYLGVGGGVATPPIVRGIDQTMVVSNGLDVAGVRMSWDVASASLLIGCANVMTAAQARSIYGIWNSVGNGDGAAASLIYGIYTTVHGGAAGQNVCIGADITATGVVNGFVHGVIGSATNECNPGQAVGIWGRGWPAAAGGGNLGYGVYGIGQDYGVYGSAGNIGVAGTGAGAGVQGVGGNYGGYFRGNSIGVDGAASLAAGNVFGGNFYVSNSLSTGTAYGVQGKVIASDPGAFLNPTKAVGIYGSASLAGGDAVFLGATGVYGYAGDAYGVGVKGSGAIGLVGYGGRCGAVAVGTATGCYAQGPTAVSAYGSGGGNCALELAQAAVGPLITFGTVVKITGLTLTNCFVSCWAVTGAVTHLAGYIPIYNVNVA
jgi:hypothetical protein